MLRLMIPLMRPDGGRRILRGIGLVLLGTLTFGCATTQDVRMVQDDLFRVEEKINKIRKDLERVERGLGRPVKVLEEKPPFDFAKAFEQVNKEFNRLAKESDLDKRNQVEIMAKIEELRDSLQMARGEVERQQYRMSELSQKLDGLDARLAAFDAKLSALKPPKPPEGEKGSPSPEGEKGAGEPPQTSSGAPPSPSPAVAPAPVVPAIDPNKLYQVAYNDYQKGNYPLAIMGLKDFVGRYPQSARAEDAQYLLGECYYSLKEYASAIPEFENLIRLHPQSSLVPSAHLKVGYALWELNRIPEATARLNQLVKSYPSSEEARRARERLKSRAKVGAKG